MTTTTDTTTTTTNTTNTTATTTINTNTNTTNTNNNTINTNTANNYDCNQSNHQTIKGIPGSVGLTNLGNSCYMNCILQCLAQVEPLTNYILSSNDESSLLLFQKDINRTNPLGSGGKVAQAYASLLRAIWSGQHVCISPQALKQTIGTFAPSFQNTRQHDAQEFLSFLLDGLHEDLNRVRRGRGGGRQQQRQQQVSMSSCSTTDPPASTFAMDANVAKHDSETVLACKTWKNHLLRNDSIIVDHFQGMQRTSLTCPHCRNQSIKFDVYSSLSLPLQGRTDGRPINLYHALQHFTGEEQLDDGNAWYCSKCKVHVNAIKCVKLWTIPNILVLHLNRFTFRSFSRGRRGMGMGTRRNHTREGVGVGVGPGCGLQQCKIEDVVDFPVNHLNMKSFVFPHGITSTSTTAAATTAKTNKKDLFHHENQDDCFLYNLVGVVEHSGERADSGHYTATVRNSKDCRFYKCNDSHIGDATDNLKGSEVYLLFYKRKEQMGECRHRWGGMDKILWKEQGRRGEGGGREGDSSTKKYDNDHDTNDAADSEGFTMVVGKKKKKKSIVLL